MSVLVGEAWTHATRGSFILVPVASPTTSKTAATHEPECSTCRYRTRSSATCLTSRSGLPKIHPKIQPSNTYVGCQVWRTWLVGCLFPAPKAFGVPVTGDSNNFIDAITVKEELEAAQSRNGSSAADSLDGRAVSFSACPRSRARLQTYR